MRQLIGYGEDALTYGAVTERLGDFLDALGDSSTSESALVFFRPSFGRRSSGRDGGRAASFGEFDAIVATDLAVYLVEAKWSRSGETHRREVVQFRREQVRRHEVLRWYLMRWRAFAPGPWDVFRSAALAEFEAAFPTLTIPPADRHLAAHLEYVLMRLSDRGERVVDVLLYVDVDKLSCPPLPPESAFQLVTLSFADADQTGFFPMAARPPDADTPL